MTVSKNPVAEEPGGLSGKPLFPLSTDILKEMYVLTKVCQLVLLLLCNFYHASEQLSVVLAFSICWGKAIGRSGPV